MWTLIFAGTTLVSILGWVKRYVSCAALVYYMKKKKYILPNDKEIEECTDFVTQQMIRDLFK